MLEAGGASLRNLPTRGSDLAPGQYKHETSTKTLLTKMVSKRGPYDLFTGERYKSLVSVCISGRGEGGVVNPSVLCIGCPTGASVLCFFMTKK